MLDLTSVLFTVAPRVSGVKAQKQKAIISAVGPIFMSTLSAWGITSKLEIVHFIGQTMAESDGYCTTVEYATGDEYQGRMGNNLPGEGRKYKGRGFIQLTGKNNYIAADKDLHWGIVADPSILDNYTKALEISCWYWKKNNLNRWADADDGRRLGNAINRGNPNYSGQPLGADARAIYTSKAKRALQATEMTTDAFSPLQATLVAPTADKRTSEAPKGFIATSIATIAAAWAGAVSFFHEHLYAITGTAIGLAALATLIHFLRK